MKFYDIVRKLQEEILQLIPKTEKYIEYMLENKIFERM